MKEFYEKLKIYLMSITKCLCFLTLFYSSIQITIEFLSYPYIYRLNVVSDQLVGFDLPKISVCTERTVLFDKRKINSLFDLNKELEKVIKDVKNNTIKDINSLIIIGLRS